MDLWPLLTIGLALKFIHACLAVAASVIYLLWNRTSRTYEEAADCEINILIPLLREQRCLNDLFHRFTEFLRSYDQLRLIFVTTQRENLEPIQRGTTTTATLLRELISRHDDCVDRISHIHYPGYNRTLAEQLNYALSIILQASHKFARSRYLLIYNADSIVDKKHNLDDDPGGQFRNSRRAAIIAISVERASTFGETSLLLGRPWVETISMDAPLRNSAFPLLQAVLDVHPNRASRLQPCALRRTWFTNPA